MIKIRYILLFALFSLLYTLYFLPSNAHASAEWEVTLWVEASTGHNRLVLGADETAKDGYDPVWEVYAKLGGEIQAYFLHSDWKDMVHQKFWRDIREKKAPGMTTEWSFVVDSPYGFIIRWDLSRVPENYEIVLIDDFTPQQIDMHSTTSYNFLYTGVRSFRVAVTVPSDVTPPAPPVDPWATTSGKSKVVTLHWLPNTEADIAGYNVYRSLTSGSGYERLTKSLIKSPSYRGTQLKKGKTYYYVVTAVNTSGTESRYSNEVAITK